MGETQKVDHDDIYIAIKVDNDEPKEYKVVIGFNANRNYQIIMKVTTGTVFAKELYVVLMTWDYKYVKLLGTYDESQSDELNTPFYSTLTGGDRNEICDKLQGGLTVEEFKDVIKDTVKEDVAKVLVNMYRSVYSYICA